MELEESLFRFNPHRESRHNTLQHRLPAGIFLCHGLLAGYDNQLSRLGDADNRAIAGPLFATQPGFHKRQRITLDLETGQVDDHHRCYSLPYKHHYHTIWHTIRSPPASIRKSHLLCRKDSDDRLLSPRGTTPFIMLFRVMFADTFAKQFIISGLYVWKTIELLKVISKQGTRRIILGLFLINVLIILMDIGLLVLEYRNLYALERAWKPFIYSVKLKLEFVILGKLVDLVQSNKRNLSASLMDVNSMVVADSANPQSIRNVQKATFANPLYEDTEAKPVTRLDEEGKANHVENVHGYTN